MKFISYTDEHGEEHFFDATRVMFTMSQPLDEPDENGKFHKFGCKVAMNANMGFIIADEKPSSMIGRIKKALGFGEESF